MEKTPRPKHLATAIGIGLAGISLVVVLSMMQ
jgi:hypothetical protein